MSRIVEIAMEWKPDFVIVILGLMSLTMGLWLILPASTFASSPTYDVLASTAPEWVWGALMLIPGSLKVYGTFARKWAVAKTGCWWGFLAWLFFAFSFFQANPSNPVAAILFWKAILNGWFILHISDAEGGQDFV